MKIFSDKIIGAIVVALMALSAMSATYYVDGVNGNDTWNGTKAKWTSGKNGPFKTVQTGVKKLTIANSQLIIADGTYLFTSTTAQAIPNRLNLVIRSASGDASKVIISGNGTACGLKTANTVTFKDLTFANFRNSANYTGAALFCNSSSICTITNCHFIANTNAHANGQGAAIYCSSQPPKIYDCVFEDNSATAYGGAVSHNGTVNSTLTISNCVFRRNYSSCGGASYCQKNALTACGNCRFEGNTAACGGALYSAGSFQDCVFSNNVANAGGAGYPTAGCNFRDCLFVDNRATESDGGGAFRNGNDRGSYFYNCQFLRNVADKGPGGALRSVSINCGAPGNWVNIVSNCTFVANQALLSGGGAIDGLTLQIWDCLFERNRAWNNGGAVELDNSYPTTEHSYPHCISNCVFRDNETFGTTIAGGGGALDVNVQRDYFIGNCIFERNTCTNFSNVAGTGAADVACGGAVYSGWPVFLHDCTFVSNAAVNAGGAFFGCATGGILRCRFESNQVDCDRKQGILGSTYWPGAGSAIALERGTLDLTNAAENCWWNLIEDCLFTNNFCRGNGPTVYATRGGLRLRRSEFVDNEGRVDNTGIYYFAAGATVSYNPSYVHYGGAASGTDYSTHVGNRTIFQIEDCYFRRNSSMGYGGVINGMDLGNFSTLHPRSYVRNCLFESNALTKACFGQTGMQTYDGKGGAIILGGDARVLVESCTFVGNTAQSQGGALANFGTGNAVTNCVFYGNEIGVALAGTNIFSNVAYTKFKVRYSLFAPGDEVNAEEGDHNIVTSTRPFRSDAHCDYALRSAYRGQGAILDWMTSDKQDLGGRPRITDGKVDFGCYEYMKGSGFFPILRLKGW